MSHNQMTVLNHKELGHWIWGTRYLCACELIEDAHLKYEGALQRFSKKLTHIPFFLIHDLFVILQNRGALKLRAVPSCSAELTHCILKYRAVLGRLSTDTHFVKALLLIETSQYKSELIEWLFLDVLSQWSVFWPVRFGWPRVVRARSWRRLPALRFVIILLDNNGFLGRRGALLHAQLPL